MGAVDAGYQAGGLVGVNSGAIANSYATGKVDGFFNVGGLVGANKNQGPVTSSYYDKTSTGQSDTGQGLGVSENMNIGYSAGKYYDNSGTSGAMTTEIFVGWNSAIWTFATDNWPILA